MTDDPSGRRPPVPTIGSTTLAPTDALRRATMIEVALAAGVSQTTVSLVLNNVHGARFSAATRKRVLDAAHRLGYRVVGRRGAAGDTATGTIAFVVDEISTDPWMALAMDGIRDKAWEHGITVYAATTRGDADIEQVMLRQLAARPLVGLIFGTVNTRRIERLALPRDVPVVLLNCYLADHTLPSFVPAEVAGGHVATRHLVAAGHRRIGFINGEPWMDASRDRLKGYRRALANAEIEYDPDLVRHGNWEPSAGYAETRELLALKSPPTAIFCGNDIMALGCYEALKELGKRIPEDVAVVGYDDRELARYMRPPLTTVLLPHYELGVDAAEYLIENAARPKAAPMQVKVEGQLIERQSA